jgi:HSP20 family molecular chaperone IbpA
LTDSETQQVQGQAQQGGQKEEKSMTVPGRQGQGQLAPLSSGDVESTVANFLRNPWSTLPSMDSIQLKCSETPDSFQVSAVVPPSMGKDNLQLQFTDGVLSVTANREFSRQDEDGHHFTSSSSFMQRSIRLPPSADEKSIKAKFDTEQNALNITIKKIPQEQEEDKKKKNSIQID